MTDDDPFADFVDDDKTVIRPSPGGRRRQSTPIQNPPEAPQVPSPQLSGLSGTLSNGAFSRNGLVAAAFSILSLANQLRNTVSHRDIEGLHARMVKEIRRFENQALQQGFQREQVQVGRYALCAFIDEAVLNTPWGSDGIWGHKSLLITFHKEAWGGEKFFQYLNRLVRQPSANRELLELFYYCLSLGFQGKYRVAEQGSAKLEQMRENLYLLLQRQSGDIEQDLSIHWEGIKDRRNVLLRFVPLWVIASVVAVLLLAIYLGYLFLINRDSDPVFKELYSIGRETPPVLSTKKQIPESVPAPVESSYKKLRIFLAAEIAQGELEVIENKEGAVIRIRGLFASGQDRVKQKFYPLLQKVAEALENEHGEIIVAGNTDSVPIRTLQFPSNWHLSEGRAKDVADILRSSGQLKGRIVSEGRAENDPVATNKTAAGRALNRRVDIILR